MGKISDLATGVRMTVKSCVLERINSYERKILGETATVWRHVFITPERETLVYTGQKMVAAGIGKCYDITATVKAQEPQFQATRIMRPIVTRHDPRQEAMQL